MRPCIQRPRVATRRASAVLPSVLAAGVLALPRPVQAGPVPEGAVRDGPADQAWIQDIPEPCTELPEVDTGERSGPATRSAAVQALLGSPDAALREAAARALGVLVGGRGEASRDTDAGPEGTSSGKSVHHALVAGLSDPSVPVRVASACSLGRIGDRRALEALTRRADDATTDTRAAALWAIRRIESSATPPVTRPRGPASRRVRLEALSNVNGGRTLLVQVVAAFTADAVQVLMDSDARAWFSGRVRDRLGDEEIRTVAAVDVAPGDCVDVDLVPASAGHDPGAVVLFADYRTPGQHRARLDRLRGPVLVVLEDEGFNASDEYDTSKPCPSPRPTSSRAPWTS